MDSPKETWLAFSCVGAVVVASTSEAFSLLDCVEVVAQVVLDDVDVSLSEESVPASFSSSLVAGGGISELSAIGSSFTPRWF